MKSEKKIVEVKNLKKQYGDNVILKNINLHIDRGEVVSLIGPSGSGKSTILRCIADLESITSGEILIEGNNLTDKNVDKKIKKEMLLKTGMVFQTFNLFPHMSVRNNIVRTLKLVKNMNTEKAESIVKEMLSLVGLSDKINNYPNELSGGQKQRVAIAGIMAMKPKCIVLDEPTAMLDPNGRKEVIKTVLELNKKENITVILITHYMEEVIEADRVIVMDEGKIVMDGTPKEVFSHVEELKKLRLDVPSTTELAFELKQSGLDLPDGILTLDELVDSLLPILK